MSLKRNDLINPQFVSTVLVQEIVSILKQPPFNETLTLVSFDEKREYELLELIVKVMSMIDAELTVDKTDTNEVFKVLLEFLNVMSFPYSNQKQLEDDLVKGEKRLLIQILHFFITKMSELKTKYYLSKFSNALKIGEEYTGDEEIIDLLSKYRELQADFSTYYSLFEERKQTVPQIVELKEDIQKLQSDKLQLTSSINKFKKDYSNKKDFLELLEVTSKLRKEQEEDSNMDKRIIKQQYELEDYEDRLLLARQRLMDFKKNLSDKVSAFELLDSLRNQRNANRETSENLSKFEIADRKSKVKSLEEILMMPEISYDEVSKMKKDQLSLQNEIQKLENKFNNSASNSSELTIFKQNTIQAANKKETALKILEKMEKEKALLEQKYSDLEKKYEQTKGFKFVRKDDILQQAENVKKKKEIFVKLSKTLDTLKGESLILDRTISLLKNKTSEGESILKKFEDKNGGSLNAVKKELEDLSRKKQEIDLSKALTLEEYSKLIGQIRLKMQQSQQKHAPLIEEHERCKKEHETLNSVCNQKKQIFDHSVADIQLNYNKMKDVFVKFESQFKEAQNKYHQLNISLSIVDDMIKRCEAEISFIKKKEKRLNDKYKSYNDYYKAILKEQENFLKDLKEKQKKIKENYEDNSRQISFFSDLKKILAIKQQVLINKKQN